jgi:SAM-dependent methyltransferase
MAGSPNEIIPVAVELLRPGVKKIESKMKKQILDVGCGKDKVPGAIGLDWIGDTDADVICNLTKFPWPFAAATFDEVFAYNVMEHLPDVVGTMNEIHRIARPGGLVHIKTPHYAGLESWEDPTHVHHFAYESFDYFCKSPKHVQHYAKCEFRIVSKKLHFGGHPMSNIGRFLHWLSPRKYDKRWSFIFRPSTLEVHLAVVKP